MRQWRLIYDTPTNGAENMAVDAAILDAVSDGRVPPTLRLYGWNPPCLSLGYGQRVNDVDLERLAARGWDIVRRPTGGKAILHTDELTYSVSLPIQHPLAAGGVIESYREISKALLVALRHLGIHPSAERKAEGEAMSAVCFETPSHYEITVDGKKLVGSAQVRRKDGVLQHGTLPLYGDLTRICDVLRYEGEEARTEAKRLVLERATALECCQPPAFGSQQETDSSKSFVSASQRGGGLFRNHSQLASVKEALIPDPLSAASLMGRGQERAELWRLAADAIVLGFREALGIEFVNGTLTADERERAEQLRREVYGNESWTMRR